MSVFSETYFDQRGKGFPRIVNDGMRSFELPRPVFDWNPTPTEAVTVALGSVATVAHFSLSPPSIDEASAVERSCCFQHSRSAEKAAPQSYLQSL